MQRYNYINQGCRSMKRIITIETRDLTPDQIGEGCGECQTSCQSACKTSCGVANQKCENLHVKEIHNT